MSPNPSGVPAVREVAAADLGPAVAALQAAGAQYLATATSDQCDTHGRFRLDLVFRLPGQSQLQLLRAPIAAAQPEYPSLTPVLPAVHWDEREAMDLFGVRPLGHPDPRRLVLPDDWPDGVYPLRKAVPWDIHPTPGPAGWAAHHAGGEGVVLLPVGPVHAGVIESGHFVFSLMGETVLHLDVRLFQKHRGIEKVMEGQPWSDAAGLVDRICATCSASHQAAWSEAVEQILGWDVPPRARYLRTIILECERLYNHVNDIAAIPAGTGFATAAMAGAELKERILRLQDSLFGHRYLFATIRPGGVARDLPADAVSPWRRDLARLRLHLRILAKRMLRQPGFIDRIQGTGILSRQTAADLGAVGPVARSTGIKSDLRVDRPYLAYQDFAPSVPTEQEGDVAARLRIRFREADVTFELLDRLLHALPGGPWSGTPPTTDSRSTGIGVGCNESPRGANVHYLELVGGRVCRHHIRSASFANWPLLLEAVPGNLIGDFPLINKSFELCYACCDR